MCTRPSRVTRQRPARVTALCAHCHASKLSHRLLCTEPQVIHSIRHSCESKVRSLGSSVSVDRSDLLRFATVTRWAVGRA
jgi:hypothetical protein